MKKHFLAYIILATLSLIACKKRCSGKMTVVKDCTGTYLRIDEKDYLICNEELFANIPDGAEVKATFKKIESCDALKDKFVCKMLHQNEGLVTVTKIK